MFLMTPVLANTGGLFILQLKENPTYFCLMTMIVIFSICFHEYCHARTALWMGDSTAADSGHLTLNPMKQMGMISVIMLLILGFAWGAVPVNPQKLRSKYRWGEFATSMAGPCGNLILFVIGWLAFGLIAVHPRMLENGTIYAFLFQFFL